MDACGSYSSHIEQLQKHFSTTWGDLMNQARVKQSTVSSNLTPLHIFKTFFYTHLILEKETRAELGTASTQGEQLREDCLWLVNDLSQQAHLECIWTADSVHRYIEHFMEKLENEMHISIAQTKAAANEPLKNEDSFDELLHPNLLPPDNRRPPVDYPVAVFSVIPPLNR